METGFSCSRKGRTKCERCSRGERMGSTRRRIESRGEGRMGGLGALWIASMACTSRLEGLGELWLRISTLAMSSMTNGGLRWPLIR